MSARTYRRWVARGTHRGHTSRSHAFHFQQQQQQNVKRNGKKNNHDRFKVRNAGNKTIEKKRAKSAVTDRFLADCDTVKRVTVGLGK
jgi:hypothetical protein